jgi:aspartate/methionine/tyrosine aminotransferase
MTGQHRAVAELRATLQESRDELVKLLQEIPGLGVHVPQGTFYCFCDFSSFDTDSSRLAARILEKIQVVTVPGVEFGMDGFLRLSFCGSRDDIREGVRRIKWLLDPAGGPTLEAGSRVFTR